MKSKFMVLSISPELQLKRLREEDAEDPALLADDVTIWENLRDSMPKPYTYHEALGFIQMSGEEPKPFSFGIFYRGALAGIAGIIPGKDVNRITCEIGYWVGKPYRNKGIATAALGRMLGYALDEFGFNKITACVFAGNEASMRVLEKCGFQKEALMKGHAIKAGKILDEHRYTLFNPRFGIERFL